MGIQLVAQQQRLAGLTADLPGAFVKLSGSQSGSALAGRQVLQLF